MSSSMDMYAVGADAGLAPFKSLRDIPSGYTKMATGNFGVSGGLNLLCYNAETGQGDIWVRDDDGVFTKAASEPALRKGCTHMVTPNLVGDAKHDVLLYEPTGGTIDIYRSDAPGKLTLLKTTTGVMKMWSHIVVGGFGSRPFHNLFFYAARGGIGEFWASDGQGGLERIRGRAGLRRGCTQVVGGNFAGSGTADLMFYDASAGEAVFYTVDEYLMTELHTETGWRKTWTSIGNAKWSSNPWHSLIFYDAPAGELLLAETDGQGGLGAQRTHSGLPKDWSIVAGLDPVANASVPNTMLVMGYNPNPAPETPEETHAPAALSRMEFFATDAQGGMNRFSYRNGVYPGYTHIDVGELGISGGMVLGYDAETGQADMWTRTDEGGLLWATSDPTLVKGCTLVTNARLTNPTRLDLVTYEPTGGTITIYRSDAPGKLTPAATITGVRKTWTSMVRGNFNGDPYHTLFLYDAAAGVGEFHTTDGQGGLKKVGEHTGLRKGCTIAVTVNIGGVVSANDLLLYDPVAGVAALYVVDACKITELSVTPWRLGLTQILSAACSPTPWSDLVCYDPAKGELAIYTTDGKGNLSLFGSLGGLPKDWTGMGRVYSFRSGVPNAKDYVVCYNRTLNTGAPATPLPTVPSTPAPPPTPTPAPAPTPAPTPAPAPAPTYPMTGRMAVFSLSKGVLTQLTTHQKLRAWTHVLAGSFAPGTDGNANPYGDLFCFDNLTGDAETVKVGADGALTTIKTFTGLPRGATPVTVDLTGKRRHILMYSTNSDLGLYDAGDGMRLVKSYPKWGKAWTHILPGNIMAMGETADFLFYNRASDHGEIWSINKKTLEWKLQRTYDWQGHWNPVATGWFVRTTGDCILGIMNGYATGNLLRSTGAANYVTASGISVPQVDWSHLVKIRIGGEYDSILLYSTLAGRAQLSLIQDDFAQRIWSSKEGIGKWSSVVPMPTSGITQRVVFYSPN